MIDKNKKTIKIIGIVVAVVLLLYFLDSKRFFSPRKGKVLDYKYTVMNSSDNISGPCSEQGMMNKIDGKGYFINLNDDDSVTYHITSGRSEKENSEISIRRVKKDDEDVVIVVRERPLLRLKTKYKEVCPTVAIKFEKKPKHIKIINTKKEEYEFLSTK